MLQIRLSNKGTAAEGGGVGAKLQPGETVTVACPDHLVLAELPVAKSLGSASGVTLVKTVGRRSRRQLGERVHFCVRCDYPIAIYGRLTPCEHAFCLDCARSGSICYLCDERIQKIQTIKMMEGIFVCAAPHCLKSFLKKTEFESHIHANHADLLNPNPQKDGNESEAPSAKKPAASDSTVQAPPRPVFSPSSNSQVQDREDKAHRPQPRDQPPHWPVIQPKPAQPFFGQMPNHPSDPDNSRPPGFDVPGPMNRFPQPGLDAPSGPQQGILSEAPYPVFSMNPQQPPNFAIPINSNIVMAPPPFSYPPFAPDGAQQLYVTPAAPEGGTEQGSLLGFPPGPTGGMNFAEMYPRPWNVGPNGVQFDPSMMMNQGMSDSQGRVGFFQGDYGRNQGVSPSSMPHPQPMQGGNAMDSRDGKGILAPQPLPPPPPPMPRDGRGFGWQHDKRDSFGSGQD